MIRTAQKATKKRLIEAAKEVAAIARGETAPAGVYVPKQKPGPKPSGNAKVLLTLRLDPDVVAKFRATGAGWQTRMAEALKRAAV